MSVSEAQKRASRKWDKSHKDKVRKTNYKSRTRTFINKYADLNDLMELEKLIKERKITFEGDNNAK